MIYPKPSCNPTKAFSTIFISRNHRLLAIQAVFGHAKPPKLTSNFRGSVRLHSLKPGIQTPVQALEPTAQRVNIDSELLDRRFAEPVHPGGHDAVLGIADLRGDLGFG